ncbi:nuclear transport factor 2 family protein [Sphingomonas populi]|uniref:Nuclear transport factor 2 family protein n=1 Tax=Sphingomonas populi TaxID=2484750 RepID=A0A4Q6Y2K8_9SPHN|nr:nuclear transport factor 2 family protein [Sphingomonas populi]RZF63507.1 nuclear transport factor 2 family protein [Sphingomonas populi]
MTSYSVVRRYLMAMEAGDLTRVLACFAADGVVVSPVYGTVAVKNFYERLFADTIRTEIRIRDLYRAEGDPGKVVAHFDYIWERRGAPRMDTRLIDFFEFDASGEKIVRFRIVMDQLAT